MATSTVGADPGRTPRTLREFLKGPPRVSQKWLADAVGSTQSAISMILRGVRTPSVEMIKRLHKATSVPIEALAYGPRRRQKKRNSTSQPVPPEGDRASC